MGKDVLKSIIIAFVSGAAGVFGKELGEKFFNINIPTVFIIILMILVAVVVFLILRNAKLKENMKKLGIKDFVLNKNKNDFEVKVDGKKYKIFNKKELVTGTNIKNSHITSVKFIGMIAKKWIDGTECTRPEFKSFLDNISEKPKTNEPKIKFLILSPDNEGWTTYLENNKDLEFYNDYLEFAKDYKNVFEIRLYKEILPYGMLIVNDEYMAVSKRIEKDIFKENESEIPHIIVEKNTNPLSNDFSLYRIFEYYFDSLWENSTNILDYGNSEIE
ncbi:MAG: hypothetical protein ACI4II_02930 [Acutalibacteraceae bacterium]